jgi:hypothetical protein
MVLPVVGTISGVEWKNAESPVSQHAERYDLLMAEPGRHWLAENRSDNNKVCLTGLVDLRAAIYISDSCIHPHDC